MKKIPINITDFKQIIDKNYYYVDQSEFILDVNRTYVSFYNKPIKFGKTLNLSMLYYFYAIHEKENAYLFNDLKIQDYPEIKKEQNQYPVLYLPFKKMNADTYQEQLKIYADLLKNALKPYKEIDQSPYLNDFDLKELKQLFDLEKLEFKISHALRTIMYLLHKHYKKQVIVLIDDYDTPLKISYQNDYFDEMIRLMEHSFSAAFKTNDQLEKAIITGNTDYIIRSYFSSFNNFITYSVFTNRSSQYFGFTIEKTKQLLDYYGLIDQYDSFRDWYGGYHIGKFQLFQPDSLMKSIKNHNHHKPYLKSYLNDLPQSIVVYNQYVFHNYTTTNRIRKLVHDQSISEYLYYHISIPEVYQSDRLLSLLLAYGYLTLGNHQDYQNSIYDYKLPNLETKKVFQIQYLKYLKDVLKQVSQLYMKYLINGKLDAANRTIIYILEASINFYDHYEPYYDELLSLLFDGYNIIKLENNYRIIIIELLSNHKMMICTSFTPSLKYMKLESEQAIRKLDQFNDAKIKYGMCFHNHVCWISGEEDINEKSSL